MKIKIFVLVLNLLLMNVVAQTLPIKITGSVEDICMNPTISPNGEFVAFTKAGFQGIWIYKFSDNSINQITDEIAAGFAMQWSPDSKFILSRPAYYDGPIRYNAVKIYNVETAEAIQLTDYRTRMPSLPRWSNYNENVFIVTDNQIESLSTGLIATSEQKQSSSQQLVYLTNDDKIGVKDLTNNTIKIIEPIPGKKFMNISISPDNQRIAFEIYGGNLYSMKIDGTELVDLGKGYRAKWMADSQHLIYMITEDDGHQFTSSDIYIIKYDGTEKRNITNTNDKIELSPSASFVNNKIVFEVFDEGSIYFMNLD
ncbi:MAG: hypothetical protein HRF52_08390 [Ignavibacterium sp.]|jgi:Tol biopolymer transport system component|uniref:TolB family protein n=1 Tax=Ignavibacterium sp. TaxID=2651167 RepID=UPI00329A11DC